MTAILHEVFQNRGPHALSIVALKTAIVYVFLVAGLRLLGKRELGQMTVYDLVLVIIIANAVQNAMVGDDTSLVGGVVAALTLLLMNRSFAFMLSRSTALEHAMVGQPVVLVNDGEPVAAVLRHEGISEDQIMQALREHGLEKLSEAHLCILEVDGSISVVPMEADVRRTRRHFRALRVAG